MKNEFSAAHAHHNSKWQLSCGKPEEAERKVPIGSEKEK